MAGHSRAGRKGEVVWSGVGWRGVGLERARWQSQFWEVQDLVGERWGRVTRGRVGGVG